MRNHRYGRYSARRLGFQGRQNRRAPPIMSRSHSPMGGSSAVRGWWACVVAAAILATPIIGFAAPTIAVLGGLLMSQHHARRPRDRSSS